MDLNLEDLLTINTTDHSVKSRECIHREFKQVYEKSALAKYAKTMAAMANTSGGNILFGIAEKPNRVVGICPAILPDPATLSSALDNWFDPHISTEIIDYRYGDKTVVAIKVHESSVKPVICKKNSTIATERKIGRRTERVDKQILSEGAIYRRYSGKTEQIRFSELHEIFIERDQKIYSALMENMQNIQRIGVHRVGVADVSSMGKNGDLSRIYLSKESIQNLNLIDKGKFVETEAEGETSYFVAGTVKLHETTEVPVDDEDRIKPGVAAKMLEEDARKHLFPEFKISYNHLTRYCKESGFRESTSDHDDRYCKWDEQAEQWFYREAFVRHLRKELIENPRETIQKLSSKENLEKIDKFHRRK